MDDALTAELAYRRELMDRSRASTGPRAPHRPRTPWGRRGAARVAGTDRRSR